MGCNTFTDNAMISFADALANNHMLKELDLELNFQVPDRQITSVGYAALSHMLCNKSSILSTFHSNHTLEKIFIKDEKRTDPLLLSDPDGWLPKEVVSLLRINRDNSKNQAARLKIIHTHFSGHEIIMEPFMRCA